MITSGAVQRAGPWKAWGPAILIFALTFGLYVPSLRAPFIFDDAGAVVDNPTIRHVDWGALSSPRGGQTTTNRPLVNLSYALNYAWSGLQTWSYHLVNILFHALAGLCLYGIVRRLLESQPSAPAGLSALPLALAAALVWAVHPLQTESVVGIAQRTEVLSGLLYLLALYSFIRAATSKARSLPWYIVSVVATVLGTLAKETVVTAPLLILACDLTFFSGSLVKAWQSRRGYYLALVTGWIVPLLLLVSGGGTRGYSAGLGLGVSAAHYLYRQFEAIPLYLKLAVWPDPLVLDYGTLVAGFNGRVAAGGLFLIVMLVIALRQFHRRTLWGFLGVSFFLLLAPSSSIIPLVGQTVAEHRMYLPLATVVLAVGSAAYRWASRAAIYIGAATILAGCFRTLARESDYRDAVSIWSANVAAYPANPRGFSNLGLARLEQKDIGLALDALARAVELDPNYVSGRYNYGAALLNNGNIPEAATQLAACVALAPDFADAHVDYGNALAQLGRPLDAIREYKAALQLRPAADIHYNLGEMYQNLGQSESAALEWSEALRLDSSLALAHYQLGKQNESKNDLKGAALQLSEAVRLAPLEARFHVARGLIATQQEDLVTAEREFLAAVALQPNDTGAHANLGNIYILTGRIKEATSQYEQAVALSPNDARARENLAAARALLK